MISDKTSPDYENLKNKGNERFKAKQYEAAIGFYSRAIDLKKDEPIAYANRSACYINLKRFFEAKEDCDVAIKLDSSLTKAYYRRAIALKELMRYQLALKDYKMVSSLDSQIELAKKEAKALENLLVEDKRIDVKSHDKPLHLCSKLPIKSFPLNNQYNGAKNYY